MNKSLNIPMKSRYKVGTRVVLRDGIEPEDAYYSNYGGNPKITFRPGVIGIVATNNTSAIRLRVYDVPYVMSWFYCVDFYAIETGKSERVALYHWQIQEASVDAIAAAGDRADPVKIMSWPLPKDFNPGLVP